MRIEEGAITSEAPDAQKARVFTAAERVSCASLSAPACILYHAFPLCTLNVQGLSNR